MTKEELKKAVCEAIEKRFDDIKAFGESIFAEPELGYKEYKTSAKVKEAFDELGISYTDGWGINGVKGRMKGTKSDRTVAVFGELDALVCRNHPGADETTGAAHCCGHYVQMANLMAVAMALHDTDAMKYLGGDVVLFAVPAEECIEIEYRNSLRNKGKIHFLGGKEEIIYQGGFDDIDAAMQMHVTTTDDPQGEIQLGSPCDGFISKLVEYHGKAAHAAAAPHDGINALNAAMLGLMGVNALRETFREEDYVRFHPIITSGGDLVNVVPDHVRMESYVRAASVEAIKEYNASVDRALQAGAMAVGATCEIQNLPGYLPMRQDKKLTKLLEENCQSIFGAEHIRYTPQDTGSTDMGDVSHLMPIIHPWVGCVHGALHSVDFTLFEEKTAYTKTPQALACVLIDLLYGDAQGIEDLLDGYKPLMTKEEYLEYMASIK